MISANPIIDSYQEDQRAEEWLNSRPVCCECGSPITGEDYYDIFGNILCEDCVDSMRRKVDDYVWEGGNE